jgi:hypothetical protein
MASSSALRNVARLLLPTKDAVGEHVKANVEVNRLARKMAANMTN